MLIIIRNTFKQKQKRQITLNYNQYGAENLMHNCELHWLKTTVELKVECNACNQKIKGYKNILKKWKVCRNESIKSMETRLYHTKVI